MDTEARNSNLSTRQKDYEYTLHEPQPNNGGGRPLHPLVKIL